MVIDVGGGMAAFPHADWIIDALPYDKQGTLLSGGELKCQEVLEFDEAEVVREMSDHARRARALPDLLVKPPLSFKRRMQRAIYYWRLRMAWG